MKKTATVNPGFLLEKNFRGQETIDHCFLNNILLFLLFVLIVFSIVFENFRGQSRFGGWGAPCPLSVAESQNPRYLCNIFKKIMKPFS